MTVMTPTRHRTEPDYTLPELAGLLQIGDAYDEMIDLNCHQLSLTLFLMRRLSPILILGAAVALLALLRRGSREDPDLGWQPVEPR